MNLDKQTTDPTPSPNPAVVVTRPLIPAWWWLFAAAVAVAAVLGLGLGVNGIYADKAQNEAAAAANKARDAETARIQTCITQVLDTSSGGSQAVRNASVALTAADNAQRKALRAWSRTLLAALVYEGAPDSPGAQEVVSEFIDRTTVLVSTLDASLDAAENLDKVRTENPVLQSVTAECVEPSAD